MRLPRRSGAVVRYAAAAWAVAFALTSFYWAAGGNAGTETLGPGLVSLRDDPWFAAIGLWGVGIAKLAGALLALALVPRLRPHVTPTLLSWIALSGGVLVAIYGVASLAQHALMIGGVVGTPVALGRTAAFWHLVLWDPWWIAGGLLFVVSARQPRSMARQGPTIRP